MGLKKKTRHWLVKRMFRGLEGMKNSLNRKNWCENLLNFVFEIIKFWSFINTYHFDEIIYCRLIIVTSINYYNATKQIVAILFSGAKCYFCGTWNILEKSFLEWEKMPLLWESILFFEIKDAIYVSFDTQTLRL